MPSKKPRVMVYLEPEMHNFLKQWAEDDRRTVNNLIVMLLEKAIDEKRGKKEN